MLNKFYFLFFVSFWVFSCRETGVDKLRSDYLANNCNSIDTILQEVERAPSSLKPSVLSNAVNRFYFNNKKEDAKRILDKWQGNDVLNSDEIYSEYLINDLGYYHLWEGNLDSTFKYIQINEKKTLKDTWSKYAFINLKGSFFYIKGDLQTSKSHFLEGFILAKKQNISIYIEKFSVNLGAIAFEENQYGTASKFFSSAYQIVKRENRKNPGLINNLAAIYLQEQNIDLAYNTILKLRDELEPKSSNYYAILAKINFANILIAKNELNRAYQTLDNISQFAIPESLLGEYLIARLKIIQEKEWNGIDQFVEVYKDNLIKFNSILIQKFGPGLMELITKKPHFFSILKLNKSDSLFSKLPIYNYYQNKLRALNYKQTGNIVTAYNTMVLADLSLQKYNAISDSVKLADLANSLQLLELEEEFKNQKIQLDFSQNELTKNRSIITLLFIVVIVVGLLGFYIYQNKNQKVQFAHLQLLNKTREAEFLTKETKLNSRITELSKIIIEKSKFLAESIKQGPYANEPEIFAVQKELEQLSLIDTALDSQAAKEVFQSKRNYIEIPAFKDLNETQQRILILSVEEYKAKEIAVALNLSPAYIRNVKTLLRKILNTMGLENFKDLKNYTN